MTIRVGQAVVQGNKVIISPPTFGFGAVDAVRLTNYTQNVLIISNIGSTDISEEYLLPLQQMVYQTRNVSTIPTVNVLDIGAAIATPPTVLVEWATDGLHDFTGTYPTVIGEPAGAPYLYVTAPLIQQDGGSSFNYMQIAANPFRKSLTIINNNDAGLSNILRWSTDLDSLHAAGAIILPGSGRTINSTAAVYLYNTGDDAASATLELNEESWGPQSLEIFNWIV